MHTPYYEQHCEGSPAIKPNNWERLSCEMTTKRTSLAAAIVVAPHLSGVALRAVHLIAKVTLLVD